MGLSQFVQTTTISLMFSAMPASRPVYVISYFGGVSDVTVPLLMVIYGEEHSKLSPPCSSYGYTGSLVEEYQAGAVSDITPPHFESTGPGLKVNVASALSPTISGSTLNVPSLTVTKAYGTLYLGFNLLPAEVENTISPHCP